MSELKQLQTAIKDGISANFAGTVPTVELYGDQFQGAVPTPAIIISMDDADVGQSLGDGRLALDCRFSAVCLLGFNTVDVQVEVREFALQLLQLVRYNTWGMPDDVESPSNLAMQPGPFNPDKSGYESFIVSWDQTVFVGESVWGGVPVNTAIELHFATQGEETAVVQ